MKQNLYQKIQQHSKIVRYLKKSCIFAIFALFFSFLIINYYALNVRVKVEEGGKVADNLVIDKNNMISPRMFLESGKDYHKILAKLAFRKGSDVFVLKKVKVESNLGDITADQLLIKNQGDYLHFTGKPKLIIYNK